MKTLRFRSSFAAIIASAAVLLVPTESHAIFGWFGCNSCGTTAMRPVTPVMAPTFAPAACPQTVNYMPQTAYRTVVQRVPVTTFQPVSTCDPCGNRVTAMRPIVTMQTQTQVVPYTTFRPVVMPMSTGCCGAQPATTFSPVGFSTPATMTMPAASSGCSSCSAGTTTVSPSYASPTYSTPVPSPAVPSYSQPAYASPSNGQPSYSSPANTAPSLNTAPASNGSAAPRTFRDEGGVTEPESRLRPIPDTSEQHHEPANRNTNSIFTPRLLDTEDRTTYQPRRYNVIPVADEQPGPVDYDVPGPVADDYGWRAARR